MSQCATGADYLLTLTQCLKEGKHACRMRVLCMYSKYSTVQADMARLASCIT